MKEPLKMLFLKMTCLIIAGLRKYVVDRDDANLIIVPEIFMKILE
ncbi:hypothetical protein RchiOBHm_Chr7g0234751 [Rosa chinensis]|uniref:Uncharacterized protein n=1 Tax=Rosa chinensis TaxID=74649 RepID=A0A2P6PGJ2_ROSCH|nr:hypothetical protein RchiOBHm_Chr7g0234751 [Rosa chinensis]